MEYVDLYQIHRWDDATPIEETMEALHDVVRMGKARYLGASSMHAWQFAKAQHVAERHGWTRFVSMQNHYNLLYREEEREMVPLCRDQGVGLIPWSPLARGYLAQAASCPDRPGLVAPEGRRDGSHRRRDEDGAPRDGGGGARRSTVERGSRGIGGAVRGAPHRGFQLMVHLLLGAGKGVSQGSRSA